jgi:predicted ATPase
LLNSVEIVGLRGFATVARLELPAPNGEPGSGLTTIVGANNAGKSTVIETLRAFSLDQAISFTRGKRNSEAGDRVRLRIETTTGTTSSMESIAGSSETDRASNGGVEIFVVPSRRTFNPYFGKSDVDRLNYKRQQGFPTNRSSSIDQFNGRLFRANSHRPQFDAVMKKIVDPVPDWTIDQEDSGNYYIKVRAGAASHSSEGMGEGLVSLLFLVDALYDSQPGSVIVIDEPELSLHPALQRRLAKLLVDYSADRQIVVATHSPYFVSLPSLGSGGALVRVYRDTRGSQIAQLRSGTKAELQRLLGDANNPHTLGLDAREIFFLEDGVVLLEGQEDVVFLERALDSLPAELQGTRYGWGVGGAEKMRLVATMLWDLGYQKVFGLLDANKANLATELGAEFPRYHFGSIPANDIRTKPAIAERPAKPGLLSEDNRTVRPEFVEPFRAVVQTANEYMARPAQ